MMKRLLIVALWTLTMLLFANAALAMPVTVVDGPLALVPVRPEADEEAVTELALTAFDLLGADASGNALIFADGAYFSVDASAIDALMPEGARLSDLPAETDYEALVRYSKGDAVIALQQALAQLGYLEGEADGSYGGQSERAVSAFEKEIGLPETGEADARLQMLIASRLAEPVEIFATGNAASSFDVIRDFVDADLEPLSESGLTLSYDDIAGTGFISNGQKLTFEAKAAADIDRASYVVEFGIRATQIEDGSVRLEPAMQIVCTSVRRQMIESVIVKSGARRATLPIESVQVSLSGADTVESGIVLLDEAAVQALGEAMSNGEFKLRVSGKYAACDMIAGEDQLSGLSATGRAIESLSL